MEKEYFKIAKKIGVETHYENGKLKTRGLFIDGKLDGLYEVWHSNGKLRLRANYKDDELDDVGGDLYKRVLNDNGIIMYEEYLKKKRYEARRK